MGGCTAATRNRRGGNPIPTTPRPLRPWQPCATRNLDKNRVHSDKTGAGAGKGGLGRPGADQNLNGEDEQTKPGAHARHTV